MSEAMSMAHARVQPQADEVLRVEDLAVHFPVHEGLFTRGPKRSVKAVDGVSFALRRGETLGLVGESGCGKSTTGLAALRLTPLTRGKVLFEGTDITHLQKGPLRTLRRRMQMVYQDPYGSLNPRMRVRDIVAEPLIVHDLVASRKEQQDRVAALLTTVGLLPNMGERYPHEFSGGQRQRIGIARAIALEPTLLFCDEPVSALDVSVQAQVINVFVDLQQRLGLSYLFVSHDLAVVRHVSDRIAVMYLGRIVEVAPRDELYRSPLHPYTKALLEAVPVADARVEATRTRSVVQGEVPSALNPPAGCRFHTRCAHVMEVCRSVDPPLTEEAGRSVACHLHPSVASSTSLPIVT